MEDLVVLYNNNIGVFPYYGMSIEKKHNDTSFGIDYIKIYIESNIELWKFVEHNIFDFFVPNVSCNHCYITRFCVNNNNILNADVDVGFVRQEIGNENSMYNNYLKLKKLQEILK